MESKRATTRIAHPPTSHPPALPVLARFSPGITGLVQKLASNAENLVKTARIVYQLCDYTDFSSDFLKTREVVCFR